MSLTPLSRQPPALLIPDLCSPQAVLILVVAGELLTLCLVLFADHGVFLDWASLGRSSLFIQWLALGGAACLCLVRGWIARQPLWLGATSAYLLLLGLCLVLSLLVLMMSNHGILLGAVVGKEQVLRNVLICAVLAGLVLRYFHLHSELRRGQEAELESRIAALQARIRPHFLFNSLNSIAGLIPEDPDAAESAIEDLAELFRASLRDSTADIPLSMELTLCRQYLAIEHLRLGSRLRVNWQLGELPVTAMVPPLLLQPLVENAVYHGIQPRPDGGEVEICVSCDNGMLEATVTNPLPDARHPDEQGNRLALANVRDRLHALWGDQASLQAGPGSGQFIATLRFPLSGSK